MIFYVGLHQPSDAKHFDRCMISVNRLRSRKADVQVCEWMLDSGAFTQILHHGSFQDSPEKYAERIKRWSKCGNMVAAVSQDFMCEPFIIDRTGLDVPMHQRLTIERYTAIRSLVGCAAYVLPVLQGFWPEQYVSHVRQYGSLLREGQWVGVGSVCKRNTDIEQVEQVLRAIKRERPDLRLHGFGLKTTALESSVVCEALHSADSMAWSYAARKSGGDANSWREAKRFTDRIARREVRQRHYQEVLF